MAGEDWTRKELLAKAEEVTGVKVNAEQLRYARQLGCVPEAEQWPDGWRRYDQSHLDGLLDYLRTRSRLARRQLAGR